MNSKIVIWKIYIHVINIIKDYLAPSFVRQFSLEGYEEAFGSELELCREEADKLLQFQVFFIPIPGNTVPVPDNTAA